MNKSDETGRSRRTALIAILLVLAATPAFSTTKPASEPATAREFYNEGTRYLATTNLWRAEYNLERSLALQDESFQSPALYNLGHIRFRQGAEELRKGPSGERSAGSSETALSEADEAIKKLDQALGLSEPPGAAPQDPQLVPDASDDALKGLIESYLQGRGARQDLQAATKAVKAALQAHQNTLLKWQRSSGDFKSALELNQRDEDARHNAELVDRSIAKLVDQIRKLQEMAQALGKKKQELGDKMKKCRGKIPAPQMPPGGAGDEDEEERFPAGKEPKQEEAGKKDEREKGGMSPEQAAWLLDAFKLDSDRRLPMSEATRAQQPNDRSRPTW